MKCPHCGYEDYNIDIRIVGEYGDFFKLPIQMQKTEMSEKEEMKVFGCPNPECRIVFMYKWG